jgi:hypothetical protein
MTTNQNLCLFRLTTGEVVCRSCDSPPPESGFVDYAEDGTPIDPLPEPQPDRLPPGHGGE